MVTFRIDHEADMWDYDFREWCGGDNFDDRYVITGNRNFRTYDAAEWWQKAKALLNELDTDAFPGQSFIYYPYCKELSRSQRKAIVKIYENCRYSDDTETIIAVANILYPERNFECCEIHGYCQGECVDVIYDNNKETRDTLNHLESWYFGMMNEVRCEDTDEVPSNCYAPVTDDELWKWNHEGTLKKELLTWFGYPEDTECKIYTSNGYTKVKNWEEVV